MTDGREIAVVWSWEDGTRCVLCFRDGTDNLELQVLQAGQVVRRVPVTDVFDALNNIAPTLEVGCLDPKMTPERFGIQIDSEPRPPAERQLREPR
jgi:hypothetical protein